LFGGFSARAQTTVTLLGEDFDKSEVTFSVTMSPATHTWVFVDYTTTTPANMSRATFTSVSPGTLAAANQGFWLAGNATVTAMLKDVSGKFSWCAYATNVPPNAEVEAGGGYTLRGTPPFLINGNIPVYDYNFGPGTCITSITDLTCNPAGFLRTPPMTVTATAPATVCAGAPLTLTATATGGTTTAMSYTWNIAGAEHIPSPTTACITALANAGENTYTVYATNANGCVSAAATGTVTVHAVPTVTTASPVAICGTGAVTLTATASGGTTTAMTYTWKVGVAQTQNTAVNTYSPTVSAGSTYSVTITNANGCPSVAATGTITVNAVPDPPTNASSNTRCGTGDVNFSASTVSCCTIDWYTDPTGGTTVSYGSASYSANVHAGATNTYYAQSRDTKTGCVSTSRLVVTGMAHDVPTVTTTDAQAVCMTGAVTLTATAGGGTTTANTYTWIVGASPATITNGSQFSTTVSYGSTQFSVTIQNVYDCSSAASTGTVTHQLSVAVNFPEFGEIIFLQGCASSDLAETVNLQTARNYCSARQARLPDYRELLYMCDSPNLVPGGLHYGSSWLVDSDKQENGVNYIVVSVSECKRVWTTAMMCYVRCVL
jgi:hypothetical protein